MYTEPFLVPIPLNSGSNQINYIRFPSTVISLYTARIISMTSLINKASNWMTEVQSFINKGLNSCKSDELI